MGICFLLQAENWRNTLLGQNKYVWHLSCVCSGTIVVLKLKTGLNLISTKVSFHHFGSRKGLSLGTYYIFFSTWVNENQAFTLLKIDVNVRLCCQKGVERPFCNKILPHYAFISCSSHLVLVSQARAIPLTLAILAEILRSWD